MFEGIATGDVVDEECPGSTAVVGAGDGTEGFLTSCVPYLKLSIIFIICGVLRLCDDLLLNNIMMK